MHVQVGCAAGAPIRKETPAAFQLVEQVSARRKPERGRDIETIRCEAGCMHALHDQVNGVCVLERGVQFQHVGVVQSAVDVQLALHLHAIQVGERLLQCASQTRVQAVRPCAARESAPLDTLSLRRGWMNGCSRPAGSGREAGSTAPGGLQHALGKRLTFSPSPLTFAARTGCMTTGVARRARAPFGAGMPW